MDSQNACNIGSSDGSSNSSSGGGGGGNNGSGGTFPGHLSTNNKAACTLFTAPRVEGKLSERRVQLHWNIRRYIRNFVPDR